MDESKQTRVVQACMQCRSRKLKCIMDPVDGSYAPPCKRCRRESKLCTVPEPKRKRYNLESASTWTPAKRQQAKQCIETASRPVSPSPVQNLSFQSRAAFDDMPAAQQTAERPSKRQRTVIEPRICDSEDTEDAFIVSTAAPWALDFLPVTFCGTIADLSQAYGYQGPKTPSQTTSPPSTADGDEGKEPEQDASPADDCLVLPQTVSLADMQKAGPTSATEVRSTMTNRRTTVQDSNFEQDLGLDDIFDYIRFG